MYTFVLNLEKEQSRLVLLRDSKEVEGVTWPESRDMGRRLFESIDFLLKKNDVDPEDVHDFTVRSEIPELSTSNRIAETVKKMYTFGVARREKK